jgi:hypothetical protein
MKFVGVVEYWSAGTYQKALINATLHYSNIPMLQVLAEMTNDR